MNDKTINQGYTFYMSRFPPPSMLQKAFAYQYPEQAGQHIKCTHLQALMRGLWSWVGLP